MASSVGQDAALLRFLEIVVNRGPACPLSELQAELCSSAFTFEMRQAVGGATEPALRRFLAKFPSLFTVDEDLVATASDFSGASKPAGSLSGLRRPFDKVEQDAVDYFRSRFFKRETQWMSIVSLAGHLSQASPEIRKVVGPQTDFKKFLIRHPEAFIVESQKVSLKLEKLNDSNNSEQQENDDNKDGEQGSESQSKQQPELATNNNNNNNDGVGDDDQVGGSTKLQHEQERRSLGSISLTSSNNNNDTVNGSSSRCIVVRLTPNEHRALMFVKQIVERRGPVRFHNLTGFFSQAPDAIRDTIGRSKYELEQFVHSYPQIFEIDSEDVVRVRRDARLNFIIVEAAVGDAGDATTANGNVGRPGSSGGGKRPAVRALHQRRARIFHLAKLWGTIDLGKHEHVFFDRSIFPREPAYDDLRTLFAPGQFVAFNAVLAPPSSRAKWRATCVWREDNGRQPPDAAFATPTVTLNGGGGGGGNSGGNDGMMMGDDLASILAREPSVIDELDWDCSNDLVLCDANFADDFLDSCIGGVGGASGDDHHQLLNSDDALISNLRIPLGLPDAVRSHLPLLGQLYADQGYSIVDPSAMKDGSSKKENAIIFKQEEGNAKESTPPPSASLSSAAVAVMGTADGVGVGKEKQLHHANDDDGHNNSNIGDRVVHADGGRVDEACQTISTGDILATHLFYS